MAEDLALKIPLQGDVSPISQALDEMKNKVSSSMDNVKLAMGAIGIAAGTYLVSALDSAAKLQVSNTRLEDMLHNQGISFNNAKGDVDKFAEGIEKMSVYNGVDAVNALTTLTQKGESYSDSLKSESALTNLAAGSNISLTSASTILAQAHNGMYMQLERLGVITKAQVKAGIPYNQLLIDINKRFDGTAAAQMTTYTGQTQMLSKSFGETKEAIGTALLPVMTEFMRIINATLAPIIDFIRAHTQMAATVLVSVAALGTLVGGIAAVTKVAAIFGPAVSSIVGIITKFALPITIAVAAFALFTLAYTKNFGGFKTFVDGIIKSVIATFGTMVNWVKTNGPVFKSYFQVYMACIPILYNQYLKPTVNLIIDAFKGVVNWVKANWHFVSDTFGSVMKAIPGFYNTYLKPILGFIISSMGQVINWIKANWPLMANTIKIVMQSIWDDIVTVMNVLKPAWTLAWNIIKDTIQPIWKLIEDYVTTAIHLVENVIKLVMDIINGNWKSAWTDLCNVAKTIFGGMGKIVGDIFNIVGGLFKGIITTAIGWGKGMIDGVISGITNAVGDIKNAVGTIVKTVTDTFHKLFDLHSPSKVMFDIGNNVTLGLIKGLSAKDIGTHVSGIISGMKGDFNTIKDFFNGIGNDIFGGSNGVGINDGVKAQISQAMKMLGIPDKYLGPLETIVQHESGGSQTVTNEWDSNAKAGHPSTGLFQMIPSTFQQYMVKGYGDIHNGLDQSLSAIRYMLGRYGSIDAVPGLKSLASGGPYIGYAKGTLNAIKGLSLKGEDGPELSWSNSGDGVLSSTNSKALLNIPGVLQELTGAIKNIGNQNSGGRAINIYGPVSLANQGDQNRTLQQLQFLSQV